MIADFKNHRVEIRKKYIYLTTTEEKILKIFYGHIGELIEYEIFMKELGITKESLRTSISRLNKKICFAIDNKSGFGYIIKNKKFLEKSIDK